MVCLSGRSAAKVRRPSGRKQRGVRLVHAQFGAARSAAAIHTESDAWPVHGHGANVSDGDGRPLNVKSLAMAGVVCPFCPFLPRAHNIQVISFHANVIICMHYNWFSIDQTTEYICVQIFPHACAYIPADKNALSLTTHTLLYTI